MLTTYLHQVLRSRTVVLYIHSHTRLHCIVLNGLSKDTTSQLFLLSITMIKSRRLIGRVVKNKLKWNLKYYPSTPVRLTRITKTLGHDSRSPERELNLRLSEQTTCPVTFGYQQFCITLQIRNGPMNFYIQPCSIFELCFGNMKIHCTWPHSRREQKSILQEFKQCTIHCYDIFGSFTCVRNKSTALCDQDTVWTIRNTA
jgi:hypothetical protein